MDTAIETPLGMTMLPWLLLLESSSSSSSSLVVVVVVCVSLFLIKSCIVLGPFSLHVCAVCVENRGHRYSREKSFTSSLGTTSSTTETRSAEEETWKVHRNIVQAEMAPPRADAKTIAYRRTHNLLLASRLLNQRDTPSPFTLILDSLNQSSKPLVAEYIRRAVVGILPPSIILLVF